MVQDEDRTMFRGQPDEGAVKRVPVVDRDGGIGSSRSVDRECPDPGAPPPMPARLLVTGVHEEPMEPWAEALGIAQPWEFPPGEEECLLDGVLGLLRIAQNP